jgi:apolipoprotein N-acyltransferase
VAGLAALGLVSLALLAGRQAPRAPAAYALPLALPPGTTDVPAADPGASWPLPAGDGWLRVALVQGSAPQEVLLSEDPADERDRGFRQLALTDLALAFGADVVVWSESGHPGTVGRMPWVTRRLQERLLRAANARGGEAPEALIGALVEVAPRPAGGDDGSFTNSALLVDGAGLAGRYDKLHLVPFGERVPAPSLFFWFRRLVPGVGDLSTGSSHAPIPTRAGRAAVFVCYEAVLAHHVRFLVRQRADILINITNDGWFDGTPAPVQHLRFSALRAAESGRPLLRCANSGISAVFGADGRAVGQLGEGQRGLLLASLPVGGRRTPYVRHGDRPIVALGAFAALAAALAATLAARRRRLLGA